MERASCTYLRMKDSKPPVSEVEKEKGAMRKGKGVGRINAIVELYGVK